MSDKPYMHFVKQETKWGLVTLAQTACHLIGYETIGKSFTCIFKDYQNRDPRAVTEVHQPFVGYQLRFSAARVTHHISCPLCRESEEFKAKEAQVTVQHSKPGEMP